MSSSSVLTCFAENREKDHESQIQGQRSQKGPQAISEALVLGVERSAVNFKCLLLIYSNASFMDSV